jgi:hypothetical protein
MTYAKFAVAGALAGLTALAAAVTDNSVSTAEWCAIGLATLSAIGVYLVPNKPAE